MGIKGGFWKIVQGMDGAVRIVHFGVDGKEHTVAIDGFVWLHQLFAVHAEVALMVQTMFILYIITVLVLQLCICISSVFPVGRLLDNRGSFRVAD